MAKLTRKQLELRRKQAREYNNFLLELYMTMYSNLLNDIENIDTMIRNAQKPEDAIAISEKFKEILPCDAANWHLWNAEREALIKEQRKKRSKTRTVIH